jgi:hypothetical protein
LKTFIADNALEVFEVHQIFRLVGHRY